MEKWCNSKIEVFELEIIHAFAPHMRMDWVFKNEESLETYRGIIHQLYAQLMGWA